MGYNYNASDASNLKEKLYYCQTESSNLYQECCSVSKSIYGELHKNTSKNYSDDYDLSKKPAEWMELLDSIVSNFLKVMKQLQDENAVLGENVNGTIEGLTGTEIANATGENSTVGSEGIIDELNDTQTVSGNGQESTVGELHIYTVNTKSGNLNVRDANGSIITSIPKNSFVKLIGETNENGYVEVEYGDGKTGYVHSDYLKEINVQEVQNNSYTHTVNTESGNLNIRDADENIITSIPKNSSVKVIGETNENGYVEVEYGDGKTGYVHSDYLKENSNQVEASHQTKINFEVFEGVVATKDTGLNIRSSPTTENNNIIGSLGKGSNVNIIGEEGNWYKISLDDGQEAYVYKKFIARR